MAYATKKVSDWSIYIYSPQSRPKHSWLYYSDMSAIKHTAEIQINVTELIFLVNLMAEIEVLGCFTPHMSFS